MFRIKYRYLFFFLYPGVRENLLGKIKNKTANLKEKLYYYAKVRPSFHQQNLDKNKNKNNKWCKNFYIYQEKKHRINFQNILITLSYN